MTLFWLILWLAGMAAIAYWCVTRHVPALQQQVQSSAQAAVDVAGARNVSLTVDGRTANLSGMVATDAIKTQLVEAVADAEGIRHVNDQLAVTGQGVASTQSNDIIAPQAESQQAESQQAQSQQAQSQQAQSQQAESQQGESPEAEATEETETEDAGSPSTQQEESAAETSEGASPVEASVEDDSESVKNQESDQDAPVETAELPAANAAETRKVQTIRRIESSTASGDAPVAALSENTTATNTDDSVEAKAQALIAQAKAGKISNPPAPAEIDANEVDSDALAEAVQTSPVPGASSLLPSFSLQVDQDTLNLNGDISNRDDLMRFIQSAMNTFSASYVVNGVQVHENREPAYWITALTRFIPSMQNIDEASVDISESQITLSGVAPDEKSHDEVINDALSMLTGLSLVERIRVSESSPSQAANSLQSEATATTDPAASSPINEQRLALREAFENLDIEKILFRSGSDVLTSDSLRSVESIAELFAQYPDVSIEIDGHTDSSGAAANNLRLSQLRANAVRDYLVQQGIPASRMSAYGFGDGVPIADNATAAGRQLNRRIEFNF